MFGMILLFLVSVLGEPVELRHQDGIIESGPLQEFLEEILKAFFAISRCRLHYLNNGGEGS